MIKKILCILLVLTLVLPISACSKYDSDKEVKILVATDLHYISPLLTENGELFRVAVDNADGKVSHYSEEITDAFVDEVIEGSPDVLILSGDLTFNGATKSHEDLVEKLGKITAAGITVLAQPGNHDVDSSQAYSFSGDQLEYAEALSSADFRELYRPFGLDKALSVDENSFSYSYQTDGNLRIIMIDANSNGRGFINDLTLEWLEDELKRAKRDRVDVMTVSHQNLYAHSSMLSFGYQLYNADKLEELLVEYGVKCHLSGHIHVQSILKDPDSEITEIATSSLTLGNIQYGSMRYYRGELSYETKSLDVSAWARKTGTENPELLDFGSYSVDYFKKNCYRQVNGAFADSELTEGEIGLLAQTFAEINLAYFMGGSVDKEAHAEGIALWHECGGSFFAGYIDSMISVMDAPRRAITVELD